MDRDDGSFVDIGGGYALPQRCNVWLALMDPAGLTRGLVRLELSPRPPVFDSGQWDGEPSDTLVRTWVTMARIDDPAGLTSWGQLPRLSTLRRVAIEAARVRWTSMSSGELSAADVEERRAKRLPNDPALMRRVAEAYRAGGRRPTAQVAADLEYSYDGAAKLVAKARRLIDPATGLTYLPPTTKGKALKALAEEV